MIKHRHDFDTIAARLGIDPERIVFYAEHPESDLIAVRSEEDAFKISKQMITSGLLSRTGKPLGDVSFYREDDEVFMWEVTLL